MEKTITDLFEISYQSIVNEHGTYYNKNNNEIYTKNLIDKSIESLVSFSENYSEYITEVKGEKDFKPNEFTPLKKSIIAALSLKTYADIDLNMVDVIMDKFCNSMCMDSDYFYKGDIFDRLVKITTSIQSRRGIIPLWDYTIKTEVGEIYIGSKIDDLLPKLLFNIVFHSKKIWLCKNNKEEKHTQYLSLLICISSLMNVLPMNIKDILQNETI